MKLGHVTRIALGLTFMGGAAIRYLWFDAELIEFLCVFLIGAAMVYAVGKQLEQLEKRK